jgi:hypothetical protein
MAAFVFPEVVEPPTDDDSGQEGSLTGSDAAEAPAVHTKKAGSKGTSLTADQRRGRAITSAAGSQATQDSCGMSPRTTRLRLQNLARLPSRLDHRASDAEERNPTNDKNFSVRDPSGPEGKRTVPLRDHGAAPTSPPGGVLRQLSLPLRGVLALTSSELPLTVPDGPT